MEENDIKRLFDRAYEEGHLGGIEWVLSHLLTEEQNMQRALFAAKSVLPLFEGKYPGDARPRKAIKAAEAYLANPSEEHQLACKVADAESAAAFDHTRDITAYVAGATAYAVVAGDVAEVGEIVALAADYVSADRKRCVYEYGLKLLTGERHHA